MSNIQETVASQMGFVTLSQLKRHLKEKAEKSKAVYVVMKRPTCQVYYNANKNHWCTYGVHLIFAGVTKEFALDYDSLTKVGLAHPENRNRYLR